MPHSKLSLFFFSFVFQQWLEFSISNSGQVSLDKAPRYSFSIIEKIVPPQVSHFLMADFDNSSKQCDFPVPTDHAILDFVTQAAKLIIKTGKGANSSKRGQFVTLLSEKHLT